MRARSRTIHRRDVLALGGAALLFARPAIAREAAPVTKLTGDAFGTGWRVTLPAGADISRLKERLAALLADIDLAFSPWRADSTLARFNAHGAGDFAVESEVVEVTSAALQIAEASGGRFDPTVGPLVARWGFGPIRDGDTPPDGWRTIRAEGDRLSKRNGGLTLDLCGIAKGHALDAIAARLDGAGVADFMLEIGGEVLARGNAPSGRRWLIGIADPVRGGVRLRVAPGRLALATSGDAVNAYEIAGRRYSHTIDPATGEPVRNGVASVTVAASTGATADALATALTVLGPERGLALAGRLDVAALFLVRNGAGIAELSNPRFDALRIA